MANVTEVDSFDEAVYQYETTDQALGGSVASGGILMKPIQALANRTKWLKTKVDALLTKRIFGGSVTVPSQTFLTVTHNKGIPVVNQSISLTKKTTNSTADWYTYAPSDGDKLDICDQTTNSFKIYASNANDNVLVDWLLFDNR